MCPGVLFTTPLPHHSSCWAPSKHFQFVVCLSVLENHACVIYLIISFPLLFSPLHFKVTVKWILIFLFLFFFGSTLYKIFHLLILKLIVLLVLFFYFQRAFFWFLVILINSILFYRSNIMYIFEDFYWFFFLSVFFLFLLSVYILYLYVAYYIQLALSIYSFQHLSSLVVFPNSWWCLVDLYLETNYEKLTRNLAELVDH